MAGDSARGYGMELALFDFDGTITREDSFSRFIRFAARPARLVAGGLALSPRILGYKLGVVPALGLRSALSRFAFRGESATRVRELGARYAREVLPELVRPEARERIAWHKERSHVVVVVSASLDVYLRPWCRSLDLELICTELEERAGILTGEYLGGDCCGAEKSRRIRERHRLDECARIYAYGDTSEDLEMLELADEAYLRWKEAAPGRRARAS